MTTAQAVVDSHLHLDNVRCKLSGLTTEAGEVSLVLDSVSDLGARERDRVMRGTALEVYARAWESR